MLIQAAKDKYRIKTISRFSFIFIVCLMTAYVIVKFNSRGAFGADGLYGYGKMISTTEIVILLYSVLSLFYIRNHQPLYLLIWIWISWKLLTCLQLANYGNQTIVFGVLEVLYCPSFFIFFYLYIKFQPNKITTVIRFFNFLLILSIILFILTFIHYNTYIGKKLTTLNDSYYVLLLLPWALLVRKPLIKAILILSIFCVIIWSMKRGPLFAMLFSMTGYYISEGYRSHKKIRLLLSIIVLCFCFTYLFIFVVSETQDYYLSRFYSITEDKGSGRIDIYKNTLRLQNESDIIEWIMGHGHDTVRKSRAPGDLSFSRGEYQSAHNDWQEVLFDYGIPGLALMVFLNIYLIKQCWQLNQQRSWIGPPMVASYLIFLITSLISHLVLYASYFSYLMAFWGTLNGIQSAKSFKRYRNKAITQSKRRKIPLKWGKPLLSPQTHSPPR